VQGGWQRLITRQWPALEVARAWSCGVAESYCG
jgi:hypothetical protein